MIVVDASAVVEAVLRSGPAGERLAEGWLCAPHLVDVEFVSAIQWNLRQGKLKQHDAQGAVEEFAAMDILRYPHERLMARVWELRDNVNPYDAVYIALAEELDEVLVTCDARLAKAPGIGARVEVLPLSA